MKRLLSFSNLVRNSTPGVAAEPVRLSGVAQYPGKYALSRRQALGIAGTLSLAAAPLASAVGQLFAARFSMVRRKQLVAFQVAGKDRWVINPASFDGTPVLTVQESSNAIQLQLRSAFFPGTTIPADFTAVIEGTTKSSLTLTLNKLNISFKAPFVPWLLDQDVPEVEVPKTLSIVCGNAGITIGSGARFQMRPSWTLSAKGTVRAEVHTAAGTAERNAVRADIQLNPTHSMLVPAAKLASLVRLHRGNNSWDVPVHVVDTPSWDVVAHNDAFETLTIESSTDDRQAYLYEGPTDGKVAVHVHELNATLPLRNPRYGYGIGADGVHEAFVANYSESPNWVIVGGVSLELSDRAGIPPLQLERVGNRITKCVVAPGLRRYTIPIDGTITQPTVTKPGVHLALMPAGVYAMALPKPSYSLASLQLGTGTLNKGELKVGGQNIQNVEMASDDAASSVKGIGKAKMKAKYREFGPKFDLTLPGNPVVTVIRPDDLVVLSFEFAGLTINKGAGTFGGTGKLIVHFQPQHIAERAFFYVNGPDKPANPNPPLPPSAPKNSGVDEPIGEPPIESVLSNPSRLVFTTPNGYSGTYSIEGLLDWSKFTLRVSPSAKPPEPDFALAIMQTAFLGKYTLAEAALDPKPGTSKAKKKVGGDSGGSKQFQVGSANLMLKGSKAAVASNVNSKVKVQFQGHSDFSNMFTETFAAGYLAAQLAKPPIKVPASDETVIEYPYRVMLSPNVYAGWSHSAKPKTNTENRRTELWHTRLGVKHSDGTVSEEAAYFRTVRAIWSPDYGTDYLMPAKFKERPFRTSLNRRDRHEIVRLTSDYDMATKNLPVKVNQLMLTALGAWADMAGNWDPLGQDQLDVETWIQRGTQGRDHFVRVCYKGFLFPFGNRATLVKETERKFVRTPRGHMAAYLMQRLYIILRQPERDLPASGLDGMEYMGRGFPFRKITITTKTTPNLFSPDLQQTPAGSSPTLSIALGNGMGSNSLWPVFSNNGVNQDVQWSCIGRDWDNNDIHFSVPLAFIANTDATGANCQNWITNKYKTETARRTVNMAGQSISYAPSAKKGDTSLPTKNFLLNGYYAPGAEINTPRFFPSMQKSSVVIEKVAELMGTNEPREIEYFLSYLKYAFEKGTPPGQGAASVSLDAVKNTAQVFVNLLSPLEMNFSAQSDKSGGIAAPSIGIGALSRLMGPIPGDFTLVGNFADEAAKIAAMADKLKNAVVAAGNFDPMQYFSDLLNAKILGDITLQDVLSFVMDVLSNLDKMPGLDKKDDFGMGDKLKEGMSNADVASMLQEVKDQVDKIKDTASEIADGVNQEVKEAKQAALDVAASVKNQIDEAVSKLNSGAEEIKKYIETEIKQWKKKVEDAANELKSEIEKALKPLKEAGNEAYKMYEEANNALNILKQGLNLVFEWQTEIKSTPGDILVPLNPSPANDSDRAILYLKAEIKKGLDLNPPEVLLFGSISNFIVNLIGTGAAQFLIIKFNRIALSVKIGEKPSIDPDIEAVEFAGPLTFINKLKDLIPSGGSAGGVGFSFSFDVQPSGVSATLTITLPNVTVGVFSLQNLSFLMRVTIPFDGRPFSAYFAFCTKDNPFRITIMMFGGGGFFGIEITPKGVRMLEAAFEFGGNFSFDCGVASGGASVMAGIYYKLEIKQVDGKDVEQSELTGYFKLTGNLSVLGLIRVSLLFELKLTWQGNGKVFGTATIEVEIEILFLSFSVGVTVERQFKGDDADPTFIDQFPEQPMWLEYCNAFA